MMPNSSGAVSDDASSGSGSNNSNGGNGGSVLKKGPWTAAEDAILIEYVRKHGEGNWNAVQKNSGLSRCGKSCRLRWANHLRPNLKKGSFSPEEERLILELHAKLGNKWARMAAQLPGRTDNEIKNYWNTRVKRRQRAGLPLYPQDIQKQASTFHLHQNNHHHHQPRPLSQSGGSSMTLSSQQAKPNFISPLSQFDPMSFSTATPLLSQHNNSPYLNTGIHGFKRFRDNGVGFTQQLSLQTPTLPSSSSLYNNHHNYTSQLLPSQNFSSQFHTNNYDYNHQSMLQNNYSGSGFSPGSTFSVKPELPSSQMSHPVASNIGSPQNANDSKVAQSYRDNSGLLDALLQEAEAMGGRGQSKQENSVQTQEEKCNALEDFLNNGPPSGPVFSDNAATPPLGSGNQWEDTSSAHSSPAEEMKKQPKLDINTSVEDDDLSSLLNSIPTTMMVSDLYHEGNETSNGQSSSVTDEDLGLDMQHLPSTTNAATTSAMDDWSLGAWNNLPGMSC